MKMKYNLDYLREQARKKEPNHKRMLLFVVISTVFALVGTVIAHCVRGCKCCKPHSKKL